MPKSFPLAKILWDANNSQWVQNLVFYSRKHVFPNFLIFQEFKILKLEVQFIISNSLYNKHLIHYM